MEQPIEQPTEHPEEHPEEQPEEHPEEQPEEQPVEQYVDLYWAVPSLLPPRANRALARVEGGCELLVGGGENGPKNNKSGSFLIPA